MSFTHGKAANIKSPDAGRWRVLRKPQPLRVGWILAIVIATLFLLRAFVADFAVVEGRSMLPSLGSGDIVFIFKAAYGLRNPFGGYLLEWGRPKNRDIVAAIRPDSGKAVIKRIWVEGGNSAADIVGGLAEDLYLLLGDNKYESIDSREFGPVPMNNILGRVILLPRF